MKTLVIWVDALHPKKLTPGLCPFLSEFAKKSNFSLLTAHLGFSTSIGASFFTGKHPAEHGNLYLFWNSKNRVFRLLSPLRSRLLIDVVNNFLRLLSGRTYFSVVPHHIPLKNLHHFDLSMDKNFSSPNSLKVPTVFDLFRKNGISFIFHKWPFIGTEKGSSYDFMTRNNSRSIGGKFLRLLDRGKDFNFLYLVELDVIGHGGPDSKQALAKLKEIDGIVGEVVAKFRQKNPGGNVIIWSDHGMCPVRGKVDVEAALSKTGLVFGKDYLCFLDSTVARFWFMSPEAAGRARGTLSALKNGHILSGQELRKFGVMLPHTRYGELFFLVDEGYLVSPNYFSGRKEVKGMHGYSPELESMQGFIAVDSKVDIGRKRVRNVVEGFGIISRFYDLRA